MSFKIIIEADRACFTRPELKVERVSYDVPTPTALIGILKSVFWKPAIKYYIDKIIVYNEIRFDTIKRNEIKSKVSYSKIKKCIYGKEIDLSIYTSEDRSQRSTTFLKDVKYGVEFHFEMTGIRSERNTENSEKYYSIIKRRLENGQFFKTPCMGLREFTVKKIELVKDFGEISCDNSLKGDIDLGTMLYDLIFQDNEKIKAEWKQEYFSDKTEALYYHPHMIDGQIDIEKCLEDNDAN